MMIETRRGRFVTASAILLLAVPAPLSARGFLEQFDGATLATDSLGRSGWAALTGDGEAKVALAQREGHATMTVDARSDRRGIWWAVIKRSVTPFIDPRALARPDRELRVEARVRSRIAPRRVNMSFNHSRTTDFHANLMEYDLPDTGWHVISLTTRGFDARPDDEIFVQLAMIDWGTDRFELDIDYIEVEVVDPANSGPDKGEPLPYRPPLPPLSSFSESVAPIEDGMIDSVHPTVNFRAWADLSDGDASPAMSIGGTQAVILRWDPASWRGREPHGWAALELTTESVQWAPTGLEEFGFLRVAEILGGDPGWERDTVTEENLLQGKRRSDVFGQMIVDIQPAFASGGKTVVAISPPVLRRLISGRTKGLVIYPQGAVNATFHSVRSPDEASRPRLHFNVK